MCGLHRRSHNIPFNKNNKRLFVKISHVIWFHYKYIHIKNVSFCLVKTLAVQTLVYEVNQIKISLTEYINDTQTSRGKRVCESTQINLYGKWYSWLYPHPSWRTNLSQISPLWALTLWKMLQRRQEYQCL